MKSLLIKKETQSDLGPLPFGWDRAITSEGKYYFVDHNSKNTSWIDPRTIKLRTRDVLKCGLGELPYGWEECYDENFGLYYVDHVNELTFSNPPWSPKIQDIYGSFSPKTIKDIKEATKLNAEDHLKADIARVEQQLKELSRLVPVDKSLSKIKENNLSSSLNNLAETKSVPKVALNDSVEKLHSSNDRFDTLERGIDAHLKELENMLSSGLLNDKGNLSPKTISQVYLKAESELKELLDELKDTEELPMVKATLNRVIQDMSTTDIFASLSRLANSRQELRHSIAEDLMNSATSMDRGTEASSIRHSQVPSEDAFQSDPNLTPIKPASSVESTDTLYKPNSSENINLDSTLYVKEEKPVPLPRQKSTHIIQERVAIKPQVPPRSKSKELIQIENDFNQLEKELASQQSFQDLMDQLEKSVEEMKSLEQLVDQESTRDSTEFLEDQNSYKESESHSKVSAKVAYTPYVINDRVSVIQEERSSKIEFQNDLQTPLEIIEQYEQAEGITELKEIPDKSSEQEQALALTSSTTKASQNILNELEPEQLHESTGRLGNTDVVSKRDVVAKSNESLVESSLDSIKTSIEQLIESLKGSIEQLNVQPQFDAPVKTIDEPVKTLNQVDLNVNHSEQSLKDIGAVELMATGSIKGIVNEKEFPVESVPQSQIYQQSTKEPILHNSHYDVHFKSSSSHLVELESPDVATVSHLKELPPLPVDEEQMSGNCTPKDSKHAQINMAIKRIEEIKDKPVGLSRQNSLNRLAKSESVSAKLSRSNSKKIIKAVQVEEKKEVDDKSSELDKLKETQKLQDLKKKFNQGITNEKSDSIDSKEAAVLDKQAEIDKLKQLKTLTEIKKRLLEQLDGETGRKQDQPIKHNEDIQKTTVVKDMSLVENMSVSDKKRLFLQKQNEVKQPETYRKK